MNLDNCFKVNNTFFKVNDILNDKTYIFLGNLKKTESIINKINKDGIKSISKEEKNTLKDLYGDFLKLTDIHSKTILVPCFINLFDTIDIVKKKIMKFINNNSLPNEQLLWVKKTNINLGFRYVSDNEDILKLDMNILKSNFNPETIPVNYTFIDTNHELLLNFVNQSDVINYINYEDYYNKFKENINFDTIKLIYFPKLNKNTIAFNDYIPIIDSEFRS